MRPATAASPTCCAPPVLIVMLQLVSPAVPSPAPPSGLLAKYTTPASRPRGVNRRYHQFALRDWPGPTRSNKLSAASGSRRAAENARATKATRAELGTWSHGDRHHGSRCCCTLRGYRVVVAGRASGSALTSRRFRPLLSIDLKRPTRPQTPSSYSPTSV